MNILSHSSFRARDIVSRGIPGLLLLGFLYQSFVLPDNFLAELSKPGIVIVLTVLAYPIGIITEQIALSIKGVLLTKSSRFSDDSLIQRFVTDKVTEFWPAYIKVYSMASPSIIAMLEQYNLIRFFWLNLFFSAILFLVVHSIVAPTLMNYLSLGSIVLIPLCLFFHIQSTNGFYYLVGLAYKEISSTPTHSRPKGGRQ